MSTVPSASRRQAWGRVRSSPPPSRRDLPRWVPPITFLIAALAFAWPALGDGGVFAATDILLAEAPYREYLPTEFLPANTLQVDQVEQLPFVLEFWESLRAGQFQLWEPDVGGGVPLFTAVYNRVLVPWNVVLLLIPNAAGVTLALVIALFVGQLGAYGLGRRLTLSRAGATLVAVAYGFSGPVTAFLLRIHEVLLFPALLYAVHGAVTEDHRRGRYMVLTGVLTAWTALAGFPAAAVMSLYVAAAWLVHLALPRLRDGMTPRAWAGAALRAGWGPAAAMGAGLCLAAVQLVPSYEFLLETGSLERSYPVWHYAGLAKLGTAVSGRVFGTYQGKDWWWPEQGYSNPVEASSTMGLLVLVLLGALVVREPSRSDQVSIALRRFFLPAGLLVLVGTYLGGPVLGLLHQLPFLDSNSFGRSRFVLALAVALAAGASLDRLRRASSEGGDTRRRRSSLAGQLVVLLTAIGFGTYEVLTIAAREGALGRVVAALTVPMLLATAGLAGAAVAAKLRRRRVATLVIVMALTAELQWGAWGFTPASPVQSAYPLVSAFDAFSDRVGSGGLYRFMAPDFRVARPNAAVVNDLSDARAAFPVTQRYRDLLVTADPGVYDTGRLKTYFTDSLDLESSVLDALAVRYLPYPLTSPPLDVGPGVSAAVIGGGGLAGGGVELRMPALAPSTHYRAVTLRVDAEDPTCSRGWLEVRSGETRSRRLLREAGTSVTFMLPDAPQRVEPFAFASTHCPVEINDEATWWPTLPATGLSVVSVDGWAVYERTTAQPRVSMAESLVRLDDRSQRLKHIRERQNPSRVAIEGSGVREGPRGPATAHLVADTPDRVEVTTSSEGPGLLVLRDAAAPGWHVEVNGEPANLLVVDHAFRGAEVPEGISRVVFRYAPTSLSLGAGLSALGALAILVLALLEQGRSRRRRGAATLSEPASTTETGNDGRAFRHLWRSSLSADGTKRGWN